MARRSDTQVYKVRDKVIAAGDLDGAPAGTRGKVVMVNGLSWIRYRVRFENGADIGFLEADQLSSAG